MVTITRCNKREKNGKVFYIVHAVDDKGYAGNCICSIAYGDKLLAASPESLHIGWNKVNKKSFLYIK